MDIAGRGCIQVNVIGKVSGKCIHQGKLATDKKDFVIALLAKLHFKCLLSVTNVEVVAMLTSGLIDQEVLMAFASKWAFSVNL